MAVDTAKVGEAMAKAIDKLEELQEMGVIPEAAKVGAAYVVVALDYPTPDDTEDRHLIPDVMSDIFVFGVPDEIYVQVGLLTMALDNIVD